MNILFLIGNGFDINLGLNTRYSDFYKFYKTIQSSNSSIQNLKNDIDKNLKNWSDLEKELGNYTNKLNSSNEFTNIFEDLSDRLGEYLENEEGKFDVGIFDKNKLQNYLIYPEDSLLPADKEIIKKNKLNWSNSIWNLNVISYNYTKTFESLINYKDIEINLGKNGNSSVILKKIEHIHGYINERMVMGVNDISQISNKEFQKNPNVIIDLVKPECNKVQKHLVDESCRSLIQNSHLICIFGSSIGDTDKIWWEIISEQLKRDCYLIIYEKTEPIPSRRPQRKTIAENEIRNSFLNKTKLTIEERELYRNKILIGINSDMFKLEN